MVLGCLSFAGNYLFARFFTLYDDDFIFTMPSFFLSWNDVWGNIKGSLLGWPQGRPLGFALAHLLSFTTNQSGALSLGYATGFALMLLNGCLLYKLATRFLSSPAALLTATVYLLYPIDNAKVILMHRVFMHMNVSVLLSALLLYTGGRRRTSYLIAPLCFLIYEPVFVVFLIAPLLVRSFKEFSWRRTVNHAVFWLIAASTMLFVRSRIGDPRVAETFGDIGTLLSRILMAIYVGLKTSIAGLTLRPFAALHATDAITWIVVLLCAGAFYQQSFRQEPNESPAQMSWILSSAQCTAIAGLAGLISGYLLCFRLDYWPPIMTIGRLSVFHGTGSIGAALLVGGIFGFTLELWPKLRRVLIAAASLYCGLLVSFGLEIQRSDYVRHSDQQAWFWHEIMKSSGEWKPGMVILVDISGQDSSRPFTSGMPLWWMVNFAPLILERMVDWPVAENNVAALPHPRVYGFVPNFETEPDGEALILKTPTWMGRSSWPRIANANFILFRFEHGGLCRITDPIKLGGLTLTPLPPSTAQPLKPSPFFEMLYSKRTDWDVVLKARNYPR